MLGKLSPEDKAKIDELVPLLKEGTRKGQEMVAKLTGVTLAPQQKATGPVPTDIDCDECGKPMVIRQGKRGLFLGCSGYPKCKNTAEVPAKLAEDLAAAAGAAKQEKPEAPADDIPTDLTIE